MRWSITELPDLHGTWTLLTGPTGGLGYHTALELARKGSNLILAARHVERVRGLAQEIHTAAPGVAVDIVPLDLAELMSVRSAADSILRDHRRIDILINNAGVMAPPERLTADGFELQIGTNHLGHFALTARLWPLLAASDARVVTVSSLMHASVRTFHLGSLDLSSPPRRYRRWRSYSESKLANLLFSQELSRRTRDRGLGVVSVAAHPGYAYTRLTSTGPDMGGPNAFSIGLNAVTRVVAQSAYQGSMSLIMAATTPHLANGSYVGPGSMRQTRGTPRAVGMTNAARNEELASQVWAASERAIGERFIVR